MLSKKTINFLYVFLIIALVLFMAFMVYWLEGIGKDCVVDPLKYYETATNLKCYCTGNLFP